MVKKLRKSIERSLRNRGARNSVKFGDFSDFAGIWLQTRAGRAGTKPPVLERVKSEARQKNLA